MLVYANYIEACRPLETLADSDDRHVYACSAPSIKLLINILLTAVIVKAAADVGTMIVRWPIMVARMRICGLLSTGGAIISSRL